jgi:hypothetical protein
MGTLDRDIPVPKMTFVVPDAAMGCVGWLRGLVTARMTLALVWSMLTDQPLVKPGLATCDTDAHAR